MRAAMVRGSQTGTGNVPRVDWFACALIAIASLTLFGVSLGLIGWYSAGLQGGLAIALTWFVCRWFPQPSVRPARVPWWTLAAVIPLIVTHFLFSGTHLLSDQDPGVYLNAGWWLAEHGSLAIQVELEELSGVAGISYAGHGYLPLPDRRVAPQFLHGLPALLAFGFGAGGAGGLRLVAPLLGALGVYAVFRLFSLWLSARWAGAAALLVAYSFPQVHLSRDIFSETLGQVLVLGGMWLAVRAFREGNRCWLLVTGFVLGTMFLVRIDALLVVVAGLASILFALLAKQSPDRHHASLWWMAAGAAPPAILGGIDVAVLSSRYALAHSSFLIPLVVLGVIGLLAYMLLHRSPRAQRALRPALLAAPWALATALVTTILVIPRIPAVVDEPYGLVVEAQQNERLVVDATRSFAEQSPLWPGWYLGWPLTVVGMTALVMALRYRILGRPNIPSTILLLLVAGTLLANALSPGITPVQPWASRRLAMVALPGLIGLAVWGASMWAGSETRKRRLAFGGVFVALASVIFASYPSYSIRPQEGIVGILEDECTRIPDGALVVIAGDGLLDDWLGMSLRNVCATDVVNVPWGRVDDVARSWGEPLWVISEATACLPAGWESRSENVTIYERTVTRLPSGPARQSLVIASGPWLDTGSGGASRSVGQGEVTRIDFDMVVEALPADGSAIVVSSGSYPRGWWLELRPDASADFFVVDGAGTRSVSLPPGTFGDGVPRHLSIEARSGNARLTCGGDLVGELTGVQLAPPVVGGVYGTEFASRQFRGSVDGLLVTRSDS